MAHVATRPLPVVGFEFAAMPDRRVVAEELRHEHEQLQRYEAELRSQGREVTAMLVSGRPDDKTLEEAGRLDPDLIVVGSHGHGALYHLIMGSITEGILKRSPYPVVVIPAGAEARLRAAAADTRREETLAGA